MPNDLADRWEQFAEQMGVTAPEAYRLAMQELMKGEGELGTRLARLAAYAASLTKKLPETAAEPGKAVGAFRPGRQIDRTPTKRVELQLRETERGAVATVAKEQGITPAQWIVALVRAVLSRGVLAPSSELEALKASTFQLVAIGRNLNQIAHHINADPTQLHRITGRQVERLAAAIAEHRRKVDALIDRTLERWILVAEGAKRRG